MQGVVIDKEAGGVSCDQVPRPEVSTVAGECLLRVSLAGICSTDIEVVRGYKNAPDDMILGHEFVGIIECIASNDEEAGCSPKFRRGDRVCAEINCTTPGVCKDWRERAQNPDRSALGIFGANGVFAEYVKVPVENLHLIPPDITDRNAVFVEPLAAACNVLSALDPTQDRSCAVVGAGKLGSLVAAVLSCFMYEVTVIVRTEKLSSLNGLDHLQKLTDRRISVCDFKSTSPDTFDAVVDCTGNSSGLQTALCLVKPRGTVILKSTYAQNSNRMCELDLSIAVVKEVRIVGNRCGPFALALKLLQNRLVKPECLISSEFPLRDASIAFEEAVRPGILKVLLRP